jgi:hypothetical protein
MDDCLVFHVFPWMIPTEATKKKFFKETFDVGSFFGNNSYVLKWEA